MLRRSNPKTCRRCRRRGKTAASGVKDNRSMLKHRFRPSITAARPDFDGYMSMSSLHGTR